MTNTVGCIPKLAFVHTMSLCKNVSMYIRDLQTSSSILKACRGSSLYSMFTHTCVCVCMCRYTYIDLYIQVRIRVCRVMEWNGLEWR